ncbi:MAG: 5'-deoxynucleotidase, partial [Clostridia bacterium]|nr:5'-deoxynucleotidase [Clostridia bacterium]
MNLEVLTVSSFFSMIFRMKYINRWGLMNNKRTENLSEHSLEVAMIAHCLATIGNVRLQKNLDADHIAVMGLFHDCTEIITGDMPTPVKYYNEEIRRTYKEIEKKAASELVRLLPDDMQSIYEPLLYEQGNTEYEAKLVKAADKISAYIKCIEEV